MGNLSSYLADFFQDQTKPTKNLLTNLLLSMLVLGDEPSIRHQYQYFLKDNTNSSLNSYYRACANPRLKDINLLQKLTRQALKACAKYAKEPIFISCDDTIIEKAGSNFGAVSLLYDHAHHHGYTIGIYRVCHKVVLTKIFGNQQVHAYITETLSGSRRLFFSTLSPEELHMSWTAQANSDLRHPGPDEYICYPLRLYALRWNIEVNYYEQKKFWSLGKYMVRSKTGISHMVNFINLLHCSMRLLPYLLPDFCSLRGKSAQEIRFILRQEIQREIIFGRLGLKTKQLKKFKLGKKP